MLHGSFMQHNGTDCASYQGRRDVQPRAELRSVDRNSRETLYLTAAISKIWRILLTKFYGTELLTQLIDII